MELFERAGEAGRAEGDAAAGKAVLLLPPLLPVNTMMLLDLRTTRKFTAIRCSHSKLVVHGQSTPKRFWVASSCSSVAPIAPEGDGYLSMTWPLAVYESLGVRSEASLRALWPLTTAAAVLTELANTLIASRGAAIAAAATSVVARKMATAHKMGAAA